MKKITADCICWSETGIWAINNQLKILFRYSSITGEVNYLCPLPDFIYYGTKEISLYQKKVFLYPYWNKELFIFDIDKEEWSRIDIVKSVERFPNTYYGGIVNQFVYMYVSVTGTIVGLDANTLQLEYYNIPKDYVGKVSASDAKWLEHGYIFPVVDNNRLLYFDLNSKNIKEYAINELLSGIVTVACDEKDYWLTGKNNEVIKWDKEKSQIIQKWSLPDKLETYVTQNNNWIKYSEIEDNNKFPFLKSIIVDNKLWLFPYLSNMILQIDINTGQQKEIIFSQLESIGGQKPCEYLGMNEHSQQLIIKDYRNDIYYIDAVTAEISKESISLSKEYIVELLSYRKILSETDELNLNDLITTSYQYTGSLRTYSRNTIGEAVHNLVGDK